VLADRSCTPRADYVAGIALVALAEDHLSRLKAAGDGDLGHVLELVLGQCGEHRHAVQQGERLPAGRRHGEMLLGEIERPLALSAPERGPQLPDDRGRDP
jgi:hypothetical protein